MPPKHRDISAFLQLVRDFLLGRKHVTHHRYADTVSPRTLPPHRPLEQPQGRLADNSYYSRDARCLVKPPIDLVEQKKREDAAKAAAAEAAKVAAEAAKVAAEAAKASADGKAAGTPPKSETKSADLFKNCKENQKQTKHSDKAQQQKKLLPTPGEMHKWD